MEHQKSRLSKKKFRIGDLAEELNLKKFVIRFWEKEFGLASDRSQGGQRFYTEKELELFRMIKELLYTKGYTIAGARQQLKQLAEGTKNSIEPATKTDSSFEPTVAPVLVEEKQTQEDAMQYRNKLAYIKAQLNELKSKL